MSRGNREPTRAQISGGLSYVAQTPSFLKNFGKPKPPSPPPGQGSSSGGGGGREPLPERPREGKWARGSDDEAEEEDEHGRRRRRREDDEDDDEWGEVFGGGGDEGPQVVVLKEGRHLTAEEVKKERRRAAGKSSQSPPPPEPLSTTAPIDSSTSQSQSTKDPVKLPPKPNTAKRKLVHSEMDGKDEKGKEGVKVKKKKKADKGLLSFNEEEGE